MVHGNHVSFMWLILKLALERRKNASTMGENSNGVVARCEPSSVSIARRSYPGPRLHRLAQSRQRLQTLHVFFQTSDHVFPELLCITVSSKRPMFRNIEEARKARNKVPRRQCRHLQSGKPFRTSASHDSVALEMKVWPVSTNGSRLEYLRRTSITLPSIGIRAAF
jgi:hypothetical protein